MKRSSQRWGWFLILLMLAGGIWLEKGLRVLVRVDYDQGQSLPAESDGLALAEEFEELVQR
jgi:hypothetical protein